MEKILEVKNLEKKYNQFSLKEIDLSINKNEIVGFIGKNGAGKTTLINCLMNFIRYDCDYYIFKDKEINNDSYKYKSCIGYIGDTISMYPDSTVGQMIDFYSNVFKDDWDGDKFKNYSKAFDLRNNLKIKNLSTGMKVKLFLLLVLSRKPEILILDEPTSGLDPIIRNEIISMLRKYQSDEQGTIFFSSHITEDIEMLANRIIYIDNGKILLDIKKEDLNRIYKKVDLKENESFKLDERVVVNDKWGVIDLRDYLKDNLDKNVLYDCSLLDVYIYIRRRMKNV